MKGAHTLDGQEVGGDAADLGTHLVEQQTELLEIGFAGGIVDGGCTLGKDGCHHYVGSTCHRGFVEQHIGAFQAGGRDLIDIASRHMVELRTEFLEPEEMGVEASAPDLITTRFRDDGLAHTGQQRTNHHHTASEFCTLLDELVAL